MTAVTVFCASGNPPDPVFAQATRDLGSRIARAGWTLVYGGTYLGLMAALADSARQAGGKVVGICPRLFADKGLADRACEELILTEDLLERHRLMQRHGDAFVALPGGLGTIEEIFHAVVEKHLTNSGKPIVLLNVAGYYASLLSMLDQAIEHRMAKPAARGLFHVAQSVDQAVQYLQSHDAKTL